MPKYVITLESENPDPCTDPGTRVIGTSYTACLADNTIQAMDSAQRYAAQLNAHNDGLPWRVDTVEPVDQPETGPNPRQLKRFYTWIGLFTGLATMGLLALLLSRILHDLPLPFYLWMNYLQGFSILAIGALIILAAVRADAFIRCEDHVLLALADKLRAYREELERKEDPNRD
jgi:hypothetical protein